MKKILITFLGIISLFIATSAFAYVSWNTAPNDCPGSGIGNFTTGAGIPANGSNNCWNLTNISANPGNTINVQLYYHNTGDQSANNTKVYISVSPAIGQASTVHTFTSSLSASPTGTSLGTTTLTLPTAQALTFGSTYWYPNQSNNPTISGSQIITSNGLYLGTIAPGWSSQGSVVVSFSINNPPPPPQNCVISQNLTASPTSINSGSSATLNWGTTNCTSVSVTGPSFNSSSFNGPQTVYPPIASGSYKYTLNASGANGSVPPQDVYITVNNIPPPQDCSINSFTASPSSVTPGGASTLGWDTENCTSGSINQGVGTVYGFPNGSKTIYNINNTKTYTLTAYGANGNYHTMNVTVNVNQPEECSILSFTASPSSVTPGGASTLGWDTENCTSGSINQGVGTVYGFPNGSKTIYNINNTKTYTLTAYGANGNYDTMNVTVNVTGNQYDDCSIDNFYASPSSIDFGDSSTLYWDTDGDCESGYINKGVGNIYNFPNGLKTIYNIDDTITYTLTVYGKNGNSDSDTVTVYVDEAQNDCSISYFRASPSSIDQGDSSKLSWDTNGDCDSASINRGIGSVNSNSGNETVYPDETTTYTLTVRDNNGNSDSDTVTVDVDDNQNNCSISYFRANPTSINYGESSVLSWNTNDCTSVSISNIGSVNDDGSQTVYPTYTTTYTIYAYSSNGRSVTKTAQVYVNNYVPPPTPIYNACAVTTVATNIGQNSVTLNGLVTNSNSSGANTYFEYGKTVALGSQTNARTVSGSTSFSESLTGLSSNTVYFYRLVSNCNNGIGRGSIEIFQTQGVQTQVVTRTIVRQGTTVVGTESPIMLKIENRYQSFRVGDSVDYTVTYKNIGSKRLTDPVLQVILPKGVAFLNSSQGTYSSDTYTLTVSLNDLNPGDEGVVYLQGRVDSIDTGNAQIVTTAILVYTSPNGTQENAIAYVLNNPIFDNSLGALALFGNLFGFGIIGWLLVLVLILLAILLFRKIYRERKLK